MREAKAQVMKRGEVTVPYDSGPGGTMQFSVESLSAESMIVTVFRGEHAAAEAENFRKWLSKPDVWEQYKRWREGLPYPPDDGPGLHARTCASRFGCTCGVDNPKEPQLTDAEVKAALAGKGARDGQA